VDVVRKNASVRPYGLSVYSAASGAAESDTTVFIEPPRGMEVQSPGLEIMLGASVERSLMDVLFGPARWYQADCQRAAAGVEGTVSDLLAGVALQQLLGKAREGNGPEAQGLDSRIRGAIGSLVAAQTDDGGWHWAKAGAGNHFTTARVAWALGLAKKAGYKVPDDAMNKATARLKALLSALPNSDNESTAVVLHALASLGQADFAVANRLQRNRAALSHAAMTYLALAFAEMDRKPMAREILVALSQRGWAGAWRERCLPPNQADAEVRALVCYAEQLVDPASPRIKEHVDWLLAHRVGYRWAPDKATGPATLALSRWFARTRFDGAKYQIAIFVNEALLETIEVDPSAGTKLVAVPADRLAKQGRQRVQFRLTGRGRYAFQCVYGGFVPADKLKSTREDWYVGRGYQPAALEVDGKPLPRGFDILTGQYQHFTNPLTQLPVGLRTDVTIEFHRRQAALDEPGAHPYFVLTEPIPNGTTVIESSIHGDFERYEIGPGEITFYIGARYVGGNPYFGPIGYQLGGYLPGEYKVAPTVLRDAYRPERIAVGGGASLAVLPQGAKSKDDYRLTPRELFELGKIHYGKREFKTAIDRLAELFTTWNLNADAYKETARMLLDCHLELGPAPAIVKYFEIIKEKHPDLEITFAKILKVGGAYHEIGEYERSYLVFRATVEASFSKESEAGGFLEKQGEFLRSVAFMQRLIAEYPPEPYVAGASYALAQRVYSKAPDAPADPKLRERRIGKVELTRQAVAMLDEFLTEYPDDPAADQAAFAQATALLDVKGYKQAIERCEQFARRYAKSDLLDNYWYIAGYCHYALGDADAAIEMCRKVAEAKRPEKATGRMIESPNKNQAIYILGQVYHSLGKAADAIKEYRRVAELYLDAKQAIEYFTRKAVALPEVASVKPGDPAAVELKFRNVASADVKAYRIDLLKFGLLRRDLANITAINLAGIRPYYETALKLGDGKDYRDRTQSLSLPLKEEGAYLVVCRADDLYATGLVLVTPLTLEVQEESESGRVRATVKNTVVGRYLPEVQVRVIGSSNSEFTAGTTDLRGVFVADGINGRSTIIAKLDGKYAFHRGKEWLGSQPQSGGQSEGAPARAPAAGAPAMRKADDSGLLDNVRQGNRMNQQIQNENLDNFYKNPKKGIDAKSAY
ncbi:MAG TPA: hypothetical protein VNC50_04525, partial [Planctomycetia bacterium]|nr:hypothetical protein [Planctomycetia bacterium]